MYLLDTDTCTDAVSAHPTVLPRLERLDRAEWAISSLVLAELRFGLEKGLLMERTAVALGKFLDMVAVVALDHNAAYEAALVRAEQERAGRPARAIDQLIAGHARSLGAVLVTSNTRHFNQVDRLQIESWR